MTDSDERATGANSAAIDAEIVEAAAADHGVDADELASVVTVVGADRTDAHHEYEVEYEYATVDQRRVYGLSTDEWEMVLDRNDVDRLSAALRAAHREQADRLVEDPPAEPMVVGVDTAEEPDRIPQRWDERDG